MNTTRRSFLTGKSMWHRRVRDPELGLEGALRDRYEADQKHVVDMHEALADPPPILDRSIWSKPLIQS